MTGATFGLHTQTFEVIAEGEPARAVAAFVCGALEARDGAAKDRIEVPRLASDAESAEELMRLLGVRIVWDYADGLALHAAALELNGKVVLLPAASGVGKSTLAVYLAARGWRFLTDELVLVPQGTNEIHALARPAHLKQGSEFVLERFEAVRDSPYVWRYEHGALIAPRAFEANGVLAADGGRSALRFPTRAGSATREIAAVVFPAYSRDAVPELELLSAGSGSFALTGALVNARNLPQLGIRECARLMTLTPAYRLRYRDLDDAEAMLVRALLPK